MKSNTFFSFNRFYLLLRNDILLNYKKYLLTIIGAFILGFIILYGSMPQRIFNYDLSPFNARRYNQNFIMCLFGLLAFVGSAFSELSSKVKISNYLLLPSSTFEKYLSQIVIRVIAGTLLFLIIFWIDAQLARYASLSQMKGMNNEIMGPEKAKFIEVFHYSILRIKSSYPVVSYWNWFDGLAMICGMLSIGMYFFAVKIFFKKLGLIKTSISLIALVYSGMLVMMVLSQFFYPGTKAFDVSNALDYKLPNGYFNIEIWMYVSAYCAPFFIIPFGYFKLKEKQL